MNDEKEMVVFLDSVNRTIVAQKAPEQTKDTLTVINPAILSIAPRQGGQMVAQLIPVFFREPLADKNQKCVATYPLSSIATSNIVLDEKFIKEYDKLMAKLDIPTEPEKVDLFGEVKNG